MKKGVLTILSALTGVVLGGSAVGKYIGKKAKNAQGMSNKHLALFLMMDHWVRVKQEGKHLADYFEKKGYQKIAVYGMSYAGETLLAELKNSTVEVAYGIDRNADSLYSDVDIVSIEDDLENVDAIVVTAITFFDEIEKQLSEKMDCPIISLEDILYEIE